MVEGPAHRAGEAPIPVSQWHNTPRKLPVAKALAAWLKASVFEVGCGFEAYPMGRTLHPSTAAFSVLLPLLFSLLPLLLFPDVDLLTKTRLTVQGLLQAARTEYEARGFCKTARRRLAVLKKSETKIAIFNCERRVDGKLYLFAQGTYDSTQTLPRACKSDGKEQP